MCNNDSYHLHAFLTYVIFLDSATYLTILMHACLHSCMYTTIYIHILILLYIIVALHHPVTSPVSQPMPELTSPTMPLEPLAINTCYTNSPSTFCYSLTATYAFSQFSYLPMYHMPVPYPQQPSWPDLITPLLLTWNLPPRFFLSLLLCHLDTPTGLPLLALGTEYGHPPAVLLHVADSLNAISISLWLFAFASHIHK